MFHQKKFNFLYITLLNFIIFNTVQAANIYKWVDDQNQIHYSERPDANAKSLQKVSNIQVKTNPEQAVSPIEKNGINTPELDALNAKLKENEAAQTKQAEEAEHQKNLDKINSYNCKIAKAKIETLEHHRVRDEGAAGQIRVMPEEQRQAELAKAKLDVAQYCVKN